MKNGRLNSLTAILIVVLLLAGSCKKDNLDTSSLYVPSGTDVTANATLEELQQGRTLYINNCGRCHQLYSPDSFTASQWKSIINQMASKTKMSSAETQLVTKYVSRGN